MQSGALQHQLLKVRSVESPNGSMIAIKMRALPTRVCLTLKQCLYVCRWASAQKPYHVPHVWGYEPWGIMERTQIPLFDESFRGYGMNKITWSRHIASLGYNFVVHPTAFMVHQPHHISCAKQAWWTGKPTNSKADRFLGAGGPALQLLLTKTAYHCTHVHTHLASLSCWKADPRSVVQDRHCTACHNDSILFAHSKQRGEQRREQFDKGIFEPTLSLGTRQCMEQDPQS